MICPYCDSVLLSGTIQSRGAIRWFPDERIRVEWHPWSKAKDGFMVAPCGIGPFAYALSQTFYCPRCKTLIIKNAGEDF